MIAKIIKWMKAADAFILDLLFPELDDDEYSSFDDFL